MTTISTGRSSKKAIRLGLMLAGLLSVAALPACSHSGAGPKTVDGQTPDGTLVMHQVQAAFIGSGNGGYGTLNYQGQSYNFNVGGLGIGGIGASTIDATGEVYGLKTVKQFPGSYVQGRYGFAFGDKSSGDLWLKNNDGVILHLHAKRTGLMLSLGGDVVVITFK
ncbi:hypothetical protein ACELLULO517_06660 [Acidisoma cellulosilytica]|uniref:DUF1134 domain-containing protein n=1 Tax=Acidisoma cellulosilyticum TaxID=2802395 RepID=A0A963YZT5_9PROT|nr:hypothetical protein [Acidisoma cellulosilyticum]MCB8879909.1 hypothetical protein [Acidisoma cellulosilyticum]